MKHFLACLKRNHKAERRGTRWYKVTLAISWRLKG